MITSDELQQNTRVLWGKENTPFTKNDYKDLNKFQGNYTPIKFVIDDPKIFLIPENVDIQLAKLTASSENKPFPEYLNFKLQIQTSLFMNRFWKHRNGRVNESLNFMTINLQGIEWSELKFLNMEYIKEILFAMSIYHFGYDFTLLPHKKVTDETFERYKLFMKTFQYDNTGETIPIASKSEMKAVLLAIEYLHYLEFFGKKHIKQYMVDTTIIKEFNNWFTWQNLTSEEKNQNQSLVDKVNVLKTTINRIPEEILIRFGRGKAKGELTKLAREHYMYWNYSQTEENFENWMINEYGLES